MAPEQDAALALLEGRVMTALAEIKGDVRLVLQEQKQSSRRVDEIAAEQRRQDERLDQLAQTVITREELEQREGRMREQMAEQARRRIAVMTVVVAVIAIVVSAGISVIGIIVN